MTRRMHISIETWDRGVSAAQEVATLMAGPMKWRSRQVSRELDSYRARIEAERKSQEADTDTDADAIRLGAPEIVPVVANEQGSSGANGGPAGPAAAAGAGLASGRRPASAAGD